MYAAQIDRMGEIKSPSVSSLRITLKLCDLWLSFKLQEYFKSFHNNFKRADLFYKQDYTKDFMWN